MKTILIFVLLVIGTYQVCTTSQVSVQTGPASTTCILPKQLILNCLYYSSISSGSAWGCAVCDSSIPANPDVNAQQVQMYNYLTATPTTLTSGLNGVAC